MTAPLTDDELGARLRAALQEVSPLAVVPVPPPRFAPDADVATPMAGYLPPDVMILGAAPGSGVRRSRRRIAVAAGVLAAAAVAAGVVVATSDLGRDTSRTVTPGTSLTVTTVPTAPAVPPTGPGVGWSAYPEIVRCSAPTGTVLAASPVTSPDHLDIWTVSPDATCRAMPGEHGRYLFDPPRARSVADTPAHIEGSTACLMASTRAAAGGRSFVSYGNGDYLEFFGPSCLIRSAER